MNTSVNPTPPEYPGVTPYLIVRNAAGAIAFYTKAFGAVERERLAMPDGKIGHAEVEIAGLRIMLADEAPERGATSPETLGGSPVGLLFYVADVDAFFAHAIECGAKVRREVQDQFYGDRSGCLTDPFGHEWTIATRVENLSSEEQHKRFDEFLKQMQA